MKKILKIRLSHAGGFLGIKAAALAILMLSMLSLPAGSRPCLSGKTLYEDLCSEACLHHAVIEPSQGVDGSRALKLIPDRWHDAKFRLNVAGGKRVDFSSFSTLEFQFRSPSQDPGNPTFYLNTWDQTSRRVPIRDYITSGRIDKTFRLVRLPLSALATDDWDLGKVEALVWNTDRAGSVYYVDNIILRQTAPPVLETKGENAPFPESNTVLRLTFSRRCREDSVRDLNNYSLKEVSNPETESGVHPVAVGLHIRVVGFNKSRVPEVRYSVFLKFLQPLRNSSTYSLEVSGVQDEFCNVMEPTEVRFTYDDRTEENPNLKINQEGYLTDGPKIGYVGGYLGDLGGAVWAVGDHGGMFSWSEKTGWQRLDPVANSALRAVGGIREDDVVCVGDRGTILQWDGTHWNRVGSPTTEDLLAVHFGSTGIGWAVGKSGVCARYENRKWISVPTPIDCTLRGIWGGPGDSAWAVGDQGVILRWDRSNWVKEKQLTPSDLYAVQGDSGGRVWAVGANGTVLVRNGSRWQVFSHKPATDKTLRSISIDAGGVAWVCGDRGLLWSKSASPSAPFVAAKSVTSAALNGLAQQNTRRLWAAGMQGTLLRLLPSGPQAERPLGAEGLYAVFALPYGALRLPVPLPEVTIRDISTGQSVMTVPLKLEAANWSLSGEDVYSFDFSGLTAQGTYQAHLPGLGLSAPFRIGNDVLAGAASTVAHAFYYQRCGVPLTSPYAQESFVRPICHEYDPKGRRIDAAFHESLAQSSLRQGETPGKMIDAHGGWHDAGDFGKYVPTAAAALGFLFTAYDMDATRFGDGDWNIPESGNGIPDLLDEARWELDWLTRIQAADGGVYHKVTSQRWFEGLPQNESSPRFIFEKTTHDTALAAAVFACASRLWSPFNGAQADLYRDRALRAWEFLKRHPEAVPRSGFRNPPGVRSGEYRDPDDTDNRLWAAAELYRTTGEPEYREYFESWWRQSRDHPLGWNDWQQFYRFAYWAYLRSERSDVDVRIREDIRKRFLRKAEELVTRTSSNPYRNGARLDVLPWIGWGCFTQSTQYAFPLLQALCLRKDQRYRQAALLNLDAQLGANPLSFCFITGMGKRSPHDPLHHPSLHSDSTDPVPGLPVFGVAAHLPHSNPYYAAVQVDRNSYPFSREPADPYPILRRYIDAHQLVPMSEFTIVDIAVTAVVFHLLGHR